MKVKNYKDYSIVYIVHELNNTTKKIKYLAVYANFYTLVTKLGIEFPWSEFKNNNPMRVLDTTRNTTYIIKRELMEYRHESNT